VNLACHPKLEVGLLCVGSPPSHEASSVAGAIGGQDGGHPSLFAALQAKDGGGGGSRIQKSAIITNG